jgi:hypothetical protein
MEAHASLRAVRGHLARVESSNERTNSQLSELRRRDFFRFAAMSVLRIKARDRRLPIMLRDDVHRQSALSALRGGGCPDHRGPTNCIEMSALQN